MAKKIYEITYWAKENSGEVVENNLVSLLENFGFEIIKKIPPKTKELAYPVNKQKIGQLGTIYFYGIKEKINDFKNEVDKIKDILRFIILKRKLIKISKEPQETTIQTETNLETSIVNES